MFTIPDILNAEQLGRVREFVAQGSWLVASQARGPRFAGTKDGQQLARASGQVTEIDQMIIEALARNELFTSVARPCRFLPPVFERYADGAQYSRHVDPPILGAGQPLRADVSVTLFLSDPSDYEGGELVVLAASGEAEFKLEAGAAAVVPGTIESFIEPVTRGERLAAVTWCQSFIRDPALREVLLDLEVALSRLVHQDAASEEAALLAKSHTNLIRMFSET